MNTFFAYFFSFCRMFTLLSNKGNEDVNEQASSARFLRFTRGTYFHMTKEILNRAFNDDSAFVFRLLSFFREKR